MSDERLERRQRALLRHADGRPRAGRPASAGRGCDATLLLVLNAHHEPVTFLLPEVPDGTVWTALVDTAEPDAAPRGHLPAGETYALQGRAVVLLSAQTGV